MKKFLILQTAFIGDVILATPLAQAAHELFAPCEVHFMVIPVAANLLEKNPYIKRVWIYDKRGRHSGLRALWQLSRQLRHEKFDFAIVPHRSLRSALLVRLARIRQRIGFNRSAGAWLFTQRVAYHEKHEVERNLDLLRGLSSLAQAPSPAVFWNAVESARIDGLTRDYDAARPRLALAPGSVWATKRWPRESFAELARRLIAEHSAVVFLLGGEKDAELCHWVQREAGEGCVSLAGKLSLRESAALLDRCAVLVSNDSAPAHLGVSTRCRVLAIFGPTVPRFGFAPFGARHQVIEKDLPCRPCSTHGSHTCPIGTHACMKEIAVREVLDHVVAMIAQG